MLLHTVVYFMKGKDEKLTQCKSLFSIHCFSFIASIHKNSFHSAFMTLAFGIKTEGEKSSQSC